MGIFELLSILIPTLTKLFPLKGTAATIENYVNQAFALIAEIGSKQGAPVSSVVLSGLETALGDLQQDAPTTAGLTADALEGLRMVEAGIAAYKAAEVTTDPGTLTPLPVSNA